ncbi:cupin [Nocardia sp. NPDC050712]|uniref:1,2-dihydroxy-3-keto-5-methylthiopentene dioxygenase n=1 Tax=Nocardia sp. NPDC050712 TaxID=3155518 RepID=UPI0033E2C182
MTFLQVMPENAPDRVLLRTRDETQIADALRECAVQLRRWPANDTVRPGASAEEVLAHYRSAVDELCAQENLRLVDVVQFHPEDTPAWREQAAKARDTFLEEHRHGENEVRFFARGAGCFYLHVNQRVYAVVCEAGDLISVPAGTTHWFDMGPRPDFCAVRFFEQEDGWIGDFTGSDIAQRFPRLDDLPAGISA